MTSISSLGADLATHVLLQLDDQLELLPVRAVSSSWRAAVAAAIRLHPACREAIFPRSTARYGDVRDPKLSPTCIEARGRIFGAACLKFTCAGTDAYVGAMQSFVANTTRLLELNVGFSHVTNAALLAMCRHAPQLTTLKAKSLCAYINSRTIAVKISGLCPNLQVVELPPRLGRARIDYQNDGSNRGPAETYAMHFPNLVELQLGTSFLGHEFHVPTVLATMECCPKVTHLDASACVLDGTKLAEITAPLAARLVTLKLGEAEGLLTSTIITCVAACASLRSLQLPDTFYEADDYLALAKACPCLTSLDLLCGPDELDDQLDDDCLAALFTNLRLENIEFGNTENVTDASVDALLGSPTAKSLVKIEIGYVPGLTPEGVLRLVKGTCIRDLRWDGYDMDFDAEGGRLRDVPRVLLDELVEILTARGGVATIRDENNRPYDHPYEDDDDDDEFGVDEESFANAVGYHS